MKADKNMLAYIGAKPGSTQRDSDSWFTPSLYITLVRKVIGDIDLDPFSSPQANEVVQAKRFFHAKKSAFKHKWLKETGTVFMNPPYGRGLIKQSVDIFIKNLQSKLISESIVLVNNATETKWFQSLLMNASSACFVSKRISFTSPDGKSVSGNTRGQVFFYFGDNTLQFETVFSEIGIVMHHQPIIQPIIQPKN